jgi:branched-subunit amino acid aminotransferase/4-amino-4-deoxychorismate lyase
MKKTLIVLVALLAMVAFVSVAVAQKAEQGKTTTTTTTTTTEKAKVPKALKVTGAVVAYEAGKTIKIKTKAKELAFDIAADAKIKGEVKEGAKATVIYKKDGDKMVATGINVAAAKKPKAEKKEEKK